MKLIAVFSLLFAAANADYVYYLVRSGGGLNVDFTCTFNEPNPKGQAIEVGKYDRFLHNSTYTKNVYDCHESAIGSDCTTTVTENSCETGYEGEFCRNYGGYDSLLNCKQA